jgi:hypothetical protein
MLPWLQVEAGGQTRTLYSHYKQQEAVALEAGR